MIHKKFETILPYMSENFITYPLWEEGVYIPFVNFWRVIKTKEDFESFQQFVTDVNYETHYYVVADTTEVGIVNFSIYPDFDYGDEGSYFFMKPDWSIEEMIEIIESFINNK